MMDRESITARTREIEKLKEFNFDLGRLTWNYAYYTEYEVDAKILTDDFAPVNLFKHMKSR
jgi:hypothetical protein